MKSYALWGRKSHFSYAVWDTGCSSVVVTTEHLEYGSNVTDTGYGHSMGT